MAQVGGNREKVFENFLDVPLNIRMMFFDEMQPDDRVRMTRCSKSCAKEVQSSKNYIAEVEVSCPVKDHISINVLHAAWDPNVELDYGFSLDYWIIDGKKKKTYYDLLNGTSWEVELDNSINLAEYAMEELRSRMKIYQLSLKKLYVEGRDVNFEPTMLENADFGITSFDNLEELDFRGKVNTSQFLSKLRKPLRKLIIHQVDSQVFANYKEIIYQVQDHLVLLDKNLDIQHFSRLTAKVVSVKIGTMTEHDVFNHIRSWQNGTIGKEFEIYRWIVEFSKFDKQKFLRLLRVNNQQSRFIEIKHHSHAGRSALLSFEYNSIVFNATLVNEFTLL